MARYVLDGRLAARWLTTAPSDLAAPTQAELNGGVDLVGTAGGEALEDIQGFVVEPNIIQTPDYASLNVGTVAGDQTYPASTMSFYADTATTTIFAAFATPNTAGYIVFMYDGQGATNPCDTFPATVTSRVRRPARNAAHIFDVNFAPSAPTLNGTQAA